MAAPSQTPAVTLDHLILLLPFPILQSLPKSITSNFTLTPGGNHADGLTTNSLIPLLSGTYIELIAFLPSAPEDKRKEHRWGQKPSGWIDWALTSSSTADVEDSRHRLSELRERGKISLDLGYKPSVSGGRLRPDGKEVKWEVTFPYLKGSDDRAVRGAMPFWCHDVTPRELRVPGGEKVTAHACGAVSIAEIRISVVEKHVEDYANVYAAIVGSAAHKIDGRFQVTIGNPVSDEAPRYAGSRVLVESETENKDSSEVATMLDITFRVDGDRRIPENIEELIEGRKVRIRFEKAI